MSLAHPKSATAVRRGLPRIGPRSAGVRLSCEEFDALPAFCWSPGYRYELIEGILVVSPPPSNAEIDPNEELGVMLRLYQMTHPQGRSIDKTLPEQTIKTSRNRRRADRAIWVGLGRVPDPECDFPAILVEFVSPSRSAFVRDYQEKRDEYLSSGAREYWVIDRFRRTMTVYRRSADGILEELLVSESQSYQTPLLPGFDVPLGRLLSKADDWKKSTRKRETPPTVSEPSDPRPHDGGAS